MRILFFLEVVVDNPIQAFDIFERTNARGLPLNISDLLKNLLFAKESEITDLTSRWDKIMTKSDTRIQRILKYFDSLYNGHDTSKAVLFQHLRSTAKAVGPSLFMDEIEKFSNFFNDVYDYRLFSDEERRFDHTDEFDLIFTDEHSFKRLKRVTESLSLAGVFVPIPLIYSGLKTLVRLYKPNNKTFSDFKKTYFDLLSTIECFHFINNNIGTKPTNGPERIYAEAAKQLARAETVESSKSILVKVKNDLKEIGLLDKSTFVEVFSQLVYSPTENKPLIVYIFDRFENSPFEPSPNLDIFDPSSEATINRTYEIEHISARSKWSGDEDVLNNIGNLLIVTKSTNKFVDTDDLHEKVKKYIYHKFNHLSTVSDFCDFANNYADKALMDEMLILERSRQLANQAYDIVWNPGFSETDATVN